MLRQVKYTPNGAALIVTTGILELSALRVCRLGPGNSDKESSSPQARKRRLPQGRRGSKYHRPKGEAARSVAERQGSSTVSQAWAVLSLSCQSCSRNCSVVSITIGYRPKRCKNAHWPGTTISSSAIAVSAHRNRGSERCAADVPMQVFEAASWIGIRKEAHRVGVLGCRGPQEYVFLGRRREALAAYRVSQKLHSAVNSCRFLPPSGGGGGWWHRRGHWCLCSC